MKKVWDLEIRNALSFDDKDEIFKNLHSLLVRMHKEGVNRQDAYDIFTKIREGLQLKNEPDSREDAILECLDIITGYCSPSQTIWPDKEELNQH